MEEREDVEQQLEQHPSAANRLQRNVRLSVAIAVISMILLGIATLINRW